MSLKNSQYEQLMRDYNRRQLKNIHDRDLRVAEAYRKVPRLADIHDELSSTSAALARAGLTGTPEQKEELHKQIAALRAERDALLKANHFSADYLSIHYNCPDCRDTGYIGTQKCHCLKQASVNLLYEQSHISDILKRENFQTFSLDYYSREVSASATRSNYDYMKQVLSRCKAYAADFYPGNGNFLFTGNTGVGKTFLSNCIAKEVIERCYSVVYLTATELFDIFSKSAFSYDSDADADVNHYILESDLLILDDLGTEVSNSFTISRLFYCINERLSRKKSTIISTNLSLSELRDTYTERVASRLMSSYDVVRMYGSDIRIIKKYGKS